MRYDVRRISLSKASVLLNAPIQELKLSLSLV
ncbi:hypothetical protein SAMN05444405_102169 [Bacteroides luti]|uniref:Uncharacterized protein n=1 Tax=Bacteroides luti TaxID=1297750 RepID=A0A1M4UTL1_9BACE|nr:hypothetical protein SAMN05444405_102169 [Bacteroides luti]